MSQQTLQTDTKIMEQIPLTNIVWTTNKKQLTTQKSPYYLIFGREARCPSEVPKEHEADNFSFLLWTQEAVVIITWINSLKYNTTHLYNLGELYDNRGSVRKAKPDV